MYVYIAVVGSLYEVCTEPNPVKHISLSKYECEDFAKEYAQNHPGAEVNVFGWVAGERSKPSVTTETIWVPKYSALSNSVEETPIDPTN